MWVLWRIDQPLDHKNKHIHSISMSLTFCQTKCWLISMYFVRKCITGLKAIFIVLWLSQNKIKYPMLSWSLPNKCWIQVTSIVTTAMAQYSYLCTWSTLNLLFSTAIENKVIVNMNIITCGRVPLIRICSPIYISVSRQDMSEMRIVYWSIYKTITNDSFQIPKNTLDDFYVYNSRSRYKLWNLIHNILYVGPCKDKVLKHANSTAVKSIIMKPYSFFSTHFIIQNARYAYRL